MFGYRSIIANVLTFLCLAGVLSVEAKAKPSLLSSGTPAALPRANQRIAFDEQSIKDLKLTAANVARDPNELVKFFEANPEKLVVDHMPPQLLMTVSQLLIQARSWLLAERLMFDALRKWPKRHGIRQRYGRILIQLGRPHAARRYLAPVIKADSNNAAAQFLYGLATWRISPRTSKLEQEGRHSFEKVLSLNPNFQDVSGWNAGDIRRQLNRNSSGSVNGSSAR